MTSHRLTTGSTTQWSAATLLHTGATRTYGYPTPQHSLAPRAAVLSLPTLSSQDREYTRQAYAYPTVHTPQHRRTQPALWDGAGDYSDLA